MNSILNLSLIISLLTAHSANAQGQAAAPTPSTPNLFEQTTVPQQEQAKSPSNGSNQMIYGQEIPVFDASNETIDFMGMKYSLMDSRLGGQFTAYLVKSPADIKDAANYSAAIQDILSLLDPTTPGSPESKISKGVALLSQAAQYPQDHGICDSLKNSLYMAAQSRQKANQKGQDAQEMRQKYDRLIREMNLIETRTDLSGGSRNAGEGAAKPKMGTKEKENIKSRAALTINIKKTELQNATIANLAKWQYQANLVQLFMQRRFEHCLIGCRFYTILFQDMENDLKLEKNSKLYNLFQSELGVQPTITGLDAAASEFIGRANETCNAVENHIKIKQVEAATKRMIEAFVIGEHLTDIHTFSPEYRMKIHRYILDSNNLKEAAEVKNWEEADIYTKKLRELADDFRYIKAITAINSYKNASDTALSMFRISMGSNDQETASEHYEKALSYWPTNPRIREINTNIQDTIEDGLKKKKMLEQKTISFEDLIRNEDYRNVGLRDMATYQELFKQARDNQQLDETQRDTYRQHHLQATEIYEGLEKIETTIRTARGYADKSLYENAWEIIKLELDKENIDDSRLREELNAYSSRASRFRDLFIDAEEMIEKKNYGSALSCYLKARQINPSSILAEAGVNKIIELR